MKKIIALILSIMLIVAFALTVAGCKKAEAPAPTEAPAAGGYVAPEAPVAAPEAPEAPAVPAGK